MVVTTHPIQYATPWYRALASEQGLDVKVVFLRHPSPSEQGAGFAKSFNWDVPLLEGYSHASLDVPAGWAHAPAAAMRLARCVRRHRPDAVLVTGWNEPALVAGIAAIRALGIPVLVRGDSNAMKQRPRLVRAAQRLLLSMTSGALAVGKSNRQFFLESGVDAGAVYEGCHFVDNERFLEMARLHANEREVLRRQFGFASDSMVFSLVGKHEAVKRPLLLVEAAAKVQADGSPIGLLIAGSGELTDRMRTACHEAGLKACFLGFLNQSELWKAYTCADALVMPSQSETWGLVVNEAMLFGLPAIVADTVGCWPDLIEDDVTGYVFHGGSDELAAAMRRLIDMGPARRQRMGHAARARVAERFSMDVATRGLRRALSTVAVGT